MTRVNLILLALLIVSALGVVSARHESRRLFSELEREQGVNRQLDIEFRQLQLEQSTWAMHSRIEKVALTQLKMQMPVPSRVQVVGRDTPGTIGKADSAGSTSSSMAIDAASGGPR